MNVNKKRKEVTLGKKIDQLAKDVKELDYTVACCRGMVNQFMRELQEVKSKILGSIFVANSAVSLLNESHVQTLCNRAENVVTKLNKIIHIADSIKE